MMIRHISVLDTTLRDGEQAPGIAFSGDEKVAIAEGLADMRTDIIEAGFPASSHEERDAVSRVARAVAERCPSSTVTALSRCTAGDIATTAEALRPAARGRLHLVLSTSAVHRRIMHPGVADAELLALVKESVQHAASLIDDVQFSAQDASRSDPEFLIEVAGAARDAGATVFNVCDTVGYAIPSEFGALVGSLVAAVPELTYSVHCHNDLGLAVANSIAGLLAGARQVEVAINGIGERAGNSAHEETVMLLKTRGPSLGLTTSVQPIHLARLSALVASATGYPVAPNKAVVGANAFRHESGMHQHGVMVNRTAYEVMSAEDVGQVGGQIVLGKHSGRHALRAALASLHLEVDDAQMSSILRELKTHPERASDLPGLVAAAS
jgi:2-isopropylmalate synthase